MSGKLLDGKIVKHTVLLVMLSALIISASPKVAQASPDAKLDLIFCLDLTGSMWDDIDEVKAAAENIVNQIAAGVPDYRVAIVGYRDFGDSPMFEDYPFSNDKNSIIANINLLDVSGGGDNPEAVYEALLRAINNENNSTGGWRSDVTKIIILMGDAPPHEAGDGANYQYTINDVIVAAENVDPAIVHSIVIGDDTDAAAKFGAISSGTGGSSFTAATADDVAGAIENAIAEAVEEAQTGAGLDLTLVIVIVGVVVSVVVVTVVCVLVFRKGSKP